MAVFGPAFLPPFGLCFWFRFFVLLVYGPFGSCLITLSWACFYFVLVSFGLVLVVSFGLVPLVLFLSLLGFICGFFFGSAFSSLVDHV